MKPKKLRMFFVVFVTAIVASSLVAQITYDGCVDFQGKPVASVVRRGLGDVAMATYAADGSPIILYDPGVLAWLSPQTRLFFYAHECGHHALAHSVRNIPFSREQEADCFGIRDLAKRHLVGATDLAAIQADLSRAGGGDWTHLPGPQRAINLNRCLQDDSDDDYVIVPCTHPAHPAGDIAACTHPAHPAGDSGRCTHICQWWNGPGPCHPYDVYPCTHALHRNGDVYACSHPAHPNGDRVRR